MESTLSVVFHENTALCAVFEPNEKGWQLADIAVFSGYIDVITSDFAETSVGHQLEKYIRSIAPKIKDVRVVLPASAVVSQYMPYVPASSHDSILGLLELEIMQNAPETTVGSYHAAFFPMRSSSGNGSLMLAVLNRKVAEKNIKEMFARMGLLECLFVVRHLAAHSAFLYSYPERASETTILVNLDHSLCDISMLHKKSTAMFKTIPYGNERSACDIVVEECERNLLRKVEVPPALIVFGDALTPGHLAELEQRLGTLVHSVQRLNSFRMCTTVLDEKHRSFASRMAHRFAANVGSIMQRRPEPVK
ncbi:MAG: hypothetical protein ACK45R_10545 [Candidatus Kapaibacterium sp.]|jgi:hypothetical protein